MGKAFENRWFLLIILGITWGSSFILIKKSLLGFTPWEIGALRVSISGLLLSFIGIPALLKLSRYQLKWVAASGFFGNFFPMFLFPIAQTHVSSSMAGILDSLVPVFVLILGFLIFGLRSRMIQILGALIGFGGAAILMYFSETESGNSHLFFSFLVVLATASYAMSALIIKEKLHNIPPRHISGAVFTIWLVPSLFILLFSGFFTKVEFNETTIQAGGYLLTLTVVGTALAVALYYKLIHITSAVFASTVTYLLPVVAVIWGLIDGEQFSAWYILGGLLIFIGIYLIREKRIAVLPDHNRADQTLHVNSPD